MTAKTKAIAVFGLLGLTVLALWTFDGSLGLPPSGPGGLGQPSPITAEASGDAEQAARSATERREVVPSAPAVEPTTGTLIVEATYAEDGAPVPDLLVFVGRYGADQRFGRRRVRTDEHGLARTEDLVPGRWRVSSARSQASTWAEVHAGAETKIRLELPVGSLVTGVVVDPDGLPVAGANVYMTSPGVRLQDVEHVATTGTDGRFALRSCPSICLVGARAVGYAPSRMSLVDLQNRPAGGSKDVRIVLPAPGGTVEGLVLAPDGEPVRDALVLVADRLPSGILAADQGEPPISATARTGDDGRFRAVGIAAGDHPVRIRAFRMAPWEGTCRVEAHLVTFLEVTLSDGMSCAGVVLDGSDAPVPGVFVQAANAPEFTHDSTQTAEDGTFRLDGLPPGDVELKAYHDRGKAAAVVRGGPGETVACTLHLDTGLELRGRVLTAADAPVERAQLQVSTERTEGASPWLSIRYTDAEGRFSVTNCPAGRRLTVVVRGQGIREARVEHIDPRAGEIVIQVEATPPSARITGTVVGPDGRPVPNARVTGYGPDANRQGAAGWTSESGAFELGPLLPGTWLVAIDAEDLPDVSTEWRRLDAEVLWDLGTIQLPRGGTVRIRLRGVGGLKPRLAVGDSTLSRWASVHGEGDERRSEPIASGPHYVSVRGTGVGSQLVPVVVRDDEESDVEIQIQAGHRQRFGFVAPAPLTELHVRMLGGDELVVETSYRASLDRAVPVDWERWLAPGDYTITVTGDGLSGRAEFTVPGAPDAVVRVVLR